MSMSKKDFIALGDSIREHNRHAVATGQEHLAFTPYHIETLANFCSDQNFNFMRDRWLGYIAGTNGKNGGKIE